MEIIDSTKDYSFNTINISKESISIIDKIKKKEKKSSKKVKTIEKTNKQILCIPGCPPNLNSGIKLIFNYYGKQLVPNLYLYYKLMETFTSTSKKGGCKE